MYEGEKKTFNDPVHGTIQLHPWLVKIIDTPEFQRLRNIKQLGAAYFVYPGAQHNRFEHSIGTAHLAGKLVRHLQESEKSKNEKNVEIAGKQSKESIDDKDVLCVEIAGLCHDLGHGPFSHLFDNMFMEKRGNDWKHEEGSCKIMKKLVRENLPIGENDANKISKADIKFIKDMINPPKETDRPYKGRQETKWFLYEIISNKESGVDVDKWDYFARDCHHLGIANGFDHNRFIQFTQVLPVNGRKRICVRKKEAFNLYEMFHTRYALHKRAYQHKVVKAIELMISDAMNEVDKNHENFFKIPGTEKKCKISKCVEDLEAYRFLDDGILQMIRHSEDECLKQARELINRIWTRDLYKCVGEKLYDKTAQDMKMGESAIKKQIAEQISNPAFTENDIMVVFVNYSYGKKDLDPIQSYYFYGKEDKEGKQGIKKNDISLLLPDNFAECRVRVYCKHAKHKEAVTEAFNQVLTLKRQGEHRKEVRAKVSKNSHQ